MLQSRRPSTFHNNLSHSSGGVSDISSLDVPKATQSSPSNYVFKGLRTTSISNLSAAHSVLPANPRHVSEHPSVAARKNRWDSFSHWPAISTIYEHWPNTCVIDSASIPHKMSLLVWRFEISRQLCQAAAILFLTDLSINPLVCYKTPY